MTTPAIPTFPTDSLYKFQALAGTALVLLSMWLGEAKVERLAAYVEQERLAATELKAGQDDLIETLDAIDKHSSVRRVFSLKELLRTQADLKRRLALVRVRADVGTEMVKKTKEDINWMIWAMVIGFLFAASG